MDLIFVVALLLGDFGRTASLVDVPCPPRYKQGMFGLVLMPSFASRSNTAHANDFDLNFKYGIAGKAEVALSAYTPTNYTASFSYLFFPEKQSAPGFFGGIDDITYTSKVSSPGGQGFPDDSAYIHWGGRNPEIMSLYVAGYKKFNPIEMVLGLGRGRFVGYGPRSRYFNTDYLTRGVGTDEPKDPSAIALGLFIGAAINVLPSLALITEFDGRDANVGLRYRHKVVEVGFAASKLEQMGSAPIYSQRFSMAVEVNNSFMEAGPKTGTLSCAVVDGQTKGPLGDVVISIAETGKRFKSTKNYFDLTMPKGKYTLKVEKKDYNPQMKTVQVAAGVKTKVEFTLVKSAEAMKVDVGRVARQEQAQRLLKAGLDQVARDSLLAARSSFENILKLDSTHAQAKSYLNFVNTRIQDAIAMYLRQGETSARQGNTAAAIGSYQKVLGLDPNHEVAKREIASLTARTAVVKKPTPVVKKPTPVVKKPTPPQDIEGLYKNGISLFAQEKYDDALKVFKKIIALNPNHVGAKNYLRKTEARLKALRGG